MTSPTPCYHCALPVPAGSHFTAVVLGEPRAFCCPGCQAVAEAIVAGNLESYYQHRSEASANPDALPVQLVDELALYDRSDVQKPFVRHTGELAETTLMIEGISCAACGWLIEKHLRNLPAVAEARLNLSNHRLQVQWADSQLPLSQLLGELRHIGYASHPYQADRAAEQLASENRTALRQLGVAGLLWFQAMMATMATWPEFNIDLSPELHTILRWVALFLTTPIVFYSCAPFFKGAARDLRTRHLTMDVSVSLAIGLAYFAGIWTAITGSGELYFDAVGMFALFLLAGRYLERRARERTAAATAQLVNLLPASCLRLDADGNSQRILLRELQTGDRVLVHPGAVLPADGRIIDGQSSVDESLLTGEYLPQPRQRGDAVTAGTLNIESVLTVQVQALGQDTRLSAIVRLLERAQSEKPRLAEIADRASQWFLLFSLVAAAAIGLLWWELDPSRAFWIVLAMLVATCPCALSLATPTALTAATGTLHKLGLLLTRGHVLEGLNQIDTVIFDKTGTLTLGKPALQAFEAVNYADENQALTWAMAIQTHAEHPLAGALRTYATERHIQAEPAGDFRVQAGRGASGLVDGRRAWLGNDLLMKEQGIDMAAWRTQAEQHEALGRTLSWLAIDDAGQPRLVALMAFADTIKPEAPETIRQLDRLGIDSWLISGDSQAAAGAVGRELGIDRVEAQVLPEDKARHVQALRDQGRVVAMIGDGINDAPALSAADVGMAMATGTDVAMHSAGITLMRGDPLLVPAALDISRHTWHKIRQNLFWAFVYNSLGIPLAAVGLLNPMLAGAMMAASSVSVVANALLLKRWKPEAR